MSARVMVAGFIGSLNVSRTCVLLSDSALCTNSSRELPRKSAVSDGKKVLQGIDDKLGRGGAGLLFERGRIHCRDLKVF